MWTEAKLPKDTNYFAVHFRIACCALAGGRQAAGQAELLKSLPEWNDCGRSPTDSNYLTAVGNLAGVCSELGRDAQADLLYDLAVAGCRREKDSELSLDILRNHCLHQLRAGNPAAAAARSYWLLAGDCMPASALAIERARLAAASACIYCAEGGLGPGRRGVPLRDRAAGRARGGRGHSALGRHDRLRDRRRGGARRGGRGPVRGVRGAREQVRRGRVWRDARGAGLAADAGQGGGAASRSWP